KDAESFAKSQWQLKLVLLFGKNSDRELKMIRSFIAFEIPHEIRAKIHETFAPVRRQMSGVKWVEVQGMHLTLRFLGPVEEKLLEESIIPILEKISGDELGFSLEVKGVGVFPSLSKPRVFWLGMDDGQDRLKRLQVKIEGAVSKLPVHQEERAFHPHLTLGRIKVPDRKNPWARVLEEYEKIDFGSFPAAHVILFKSELTRAGAVYTKLREFKMK